MGQVGLYLKEDFASRMVSFLSLIRKSMIVASMSEMPAEVLARGNHGCIVLRQCRAG